MKKISEVAEELNISLRTLRYYDQIGLVCPERTEGRYRMYNESDVNRIKKIIEYRETDMPISKITKILDDPACDEIDVLKEHLSDLKERQEEVTRYIGFTEELIKETESGVI